MAPKSQQNSSEDDAVVEWAEKCIESRILAAEQAVVDAGGDDSKVGLEQILKDIVGAAPTFLKQTERVAAIRAVLFSMRKHGIIGIPLALGMGARCNSHLQKERSKNTYDTFKRMINKDPNSLTETDLAAIREADLTDLVNEHDEDDEDDADFDDEEQDSEDDGMTNTSFDSDAETDDEESESDGEVNVAPLPILPVPPASLAPPKVKAAPVASASTATLLVPPSVKGKEKASAPVPPVAAKKLKPVRPLAAAAAVPAANSITLPSAAVKKVPKAAAAATVAAPVPKTTPPKKKQRRTAGDMLI